MFNGSLNSKDFSIHPTDGAIRIIVFGNLSAEHLTLEPSAASTPIEIVVGGNIEIASLHVLDGTRTLLHSRRGSIHIADLNGSLNCSASSQLRLESFVEIRVGAQSYPTPAAGCDVVRSSRAWTFATEVGQVDKNY
ncbi:MAG: hypothetical protein KDD66_05190 [Bdellovibrionales bacterium]|nr:hypothetical protein [Bdellovibrionales bacterium]